jgi:hypothetical protein
MVTVVARSPAPTVGLVAASLAVPREPDDVGSSSSLHPATANSTVHANSSRSASSSAERGRFTESDLLRAGSSAGLGATDVVERVT